MWCLCRYIQNVLLLRHCWKWSVNSFWFLARYTGRRDLIAINIAARGAMCFFSSLPHVIVPSVTASALWTSQPVKCPCLETLTIFWESLPHLEKGKPKTLTAYLSCLALSLLDGESWALQPGMSLQHSQEAVLTPAKGPFFKTVNLQRVVDNNTWPIQTTRTYEAVLWEWNR